MEVQELRKKIDSKHWHILDGFLDGCEVYMINSNDGFSKLDNFVENYKISSIPYEHYEAIPKTLENCYCEASKLHIKELNNTYTEHCRENLNSNRYICIEKQPDRVTFTFINYIPNSNYKKVQYNEQLKQWTYCPHEREEEIGKDIEDMIDKEYTNMDDSKLDNKPNNEVDHKLESICNGTDRVLNNFKEYGFEADFEGKILGSHKGYLFGWIKYLDSLGIVTIDAMKWNEDGFSYYNNYNLTPIKKEWYEELKYPCILFNGKRFRTMNKPFKKQKSLDRLIDEGYRLPTKEEILSLYYADK